MNARPLLKFVLLVLLAANSLSGLVKIIGFGHRYVGEMALSRADLNLAYRSFRSTLYWEPDDSPTHILISHTIALAQANGLPLEPLEGRQPDERFRIGLEAVVRGIDLNPGDAWAWFNLADFHQGFRTGRLRLARMIRAGEMAVRPATGPEPVLPAGSDPDDAVSVAAALKALELEPDHFLYRDFLVKLYWDRGLMQDAAREISETMAAWPRIGIHTILENDALVADLAGPVLEGIGRSASSPYAGPVMAARARAGILERVGRLGESVEAWGDLRMLGDRIVEAECDLELGKLEMQRGNLEESLRHLARVAGEAPQSAQGIWALYYIGVIHSQKSNHTEAVRFLRLHLARAPDSYAGYQALGTELERIGESAEAERLFIAAVRRFPDNASAYLSVIGQMRHHGRSKQAISYAEALRKVSPDYEGTDELIMTLTEESVRRIP